MPSRPHEDLLRLFQNRPALAAEVARQMLHAELPQFTDARIESANLTDLRPAEYSADLVVLLVREGSPDPLHGLIVEVQLGRDPDKPFSWPAYVCNLRHRIRAPVGLLVITEDVAVARWAERPIHLGHGNVFTPLVLSPDNVPAITDERQARQDPELAVLSTIAHGSDADTAQVVRIAQAAEAALEGLATDRAELYRDMLLAALSEAARAALPNMITTKYLPKSDFGKLYYGQGLAQGQAQGLAQGQAQGRAEGRAALVARLLITRFGALSAADRSKLDRASIEELDRIGERLLTAASLAEALGGL